MQKFSNINWYSMVSAERFEGEPTNSWCQEVEAGPVTPPQHVSKDGQKRPPHGTISKRRSLSQWLRWFPSHASADVSAVRLKARVGSYF